MDNNIKKIAADLKAVNQKAEKYLRQVDEKIAQLDLEFARILITADINQLKNARKIVKQ